MIRKLALFPLLICALQLSSTAQTTPPLATPERAMISFIDANQQASNDLLTRLVNINSGTHNLDGVRAIADIMNAELSQLGFKVSFTPMDEIKRAGVLIAEHPCAEVGKCGNRMLLIGHMDTVFEKTSPFQSYSVKDNIGTGPGVNDMKGGLVIMLYALKAMKAAKVLDRAEITIVLSGDEEDHGEPTTVSRRDMIAAAHHSDVALEFEGTPRTNGIFYGSVSRRSSITWRINATGETGHSSGIFSDRMGFGANYELVRILNTFRSELPEPSLTFNIGLIAGGTTVHVDEAGNNASITGKDNVVAPAAYASGDIRTISNEQTARVEKKMQQIVAKHLPKTNARITFGEGYPAMPPTAQNRALLAILNRANTSLGFAAMPELDPMKRGAGDVAFVADIVPGLAGVGATGEGAHAPGETIDLSAQPINTKRDALLMFRLSKIEQTADLTKVAVQ